MIELSRISERIDYDAARGLVTDLRERVEAMADAEVKSPEGRERMGLVLSRIREIERRPSRIKYLLLGQLLERAREAVEVVAREKAR